MLKGLYPKRSRYLAKKLRRNQDSTLNTSWDNLWLAVFHLEPHPVRGLV